MRPWQCLLRRTELANAKPRSVRCGANSGSDPAPSGSHVAGGLRPGGRGSGRMWVLEEAVIRISMLLVACGSSPDQIARIAW